MDDRRLSDFRLSALMQSPLLKSSSDVASSLMLASQHHALPPMLPSLDAYLDAYRSLMAQDVQAMSAQLGGLGMRSPGITMPVLPTAAAAAAAAASLAATSPYYGMSPYAAVGDLARYGLLSPVYVPPFITPLLCGAGGGAPASGGLLAPAEPLQTSPGERESSVAQSAFAKSLLEACTATSRHTETAAVSHHRQLDAAPKSAPRRDPQVIDRTKPTSVQRHVAPTDLLAPDGNWNSSSMLGGKTDRADVLPQSTSSTTAVDFSAQRATAKSSLAGSAPPPESRKFTSTSAASMVADKTVLDFSTGNYFYGLQPSANSQSVVTSHDVGDRKKCEKLEADKHQLKGVRNGEVQPHDAAEAKVAPDVTRVISTDQNKHRVNDVSKFTKQEEAPSSAMSRPTSSETSKDVTAAAVCSRRLSRPAAAKKRPAEPVHIPLSAGTDLATSPSATVDQDGKSRNNSGVGGGGVEEFRCRLCNYSGRSQHCLSKHYRAHDLAYKICRYCRRAFERPSDLLRHEERHRRRDVMGTGTAGCSGGLLDGGLDGAVTSSAAADSSRQPTVGRVDTYTNGAVASSHLVSARLGTADNEVILSFDEPAADALVDQPTAPPPSKLRDVYSIMAGIFVNQHFFSFSGAGQSAAPGAEQIAACTPGASMDEQSGSGAIMADFGQQQQAFLQMLDLKMVSESGSSSAPTAAAAYSGAAAGLVLQARPGAAAVPATPPAGGRERRRKGIPSRAVSVTDAASDASVSVMGFPETSPDLTAKLLGSAAAAETDVTGATTSFAACNGAVTGVSGTGAKMGTEGNGVRVMGYARDPVVSCALVETSASSVSPRHKRGRRGRKSFNISCRVCGKRLVESWELRRHWRRHSVQDADGCYSCAACSFTSNVRLIMQSHSHVHFVRRRCTTTTSASLPQPTATHLRCRLCSKPRHRQSLEVGGRWKKTEEGGGSTMVRSLWCSECTRRRAASRLLQSACRHRTRAPKNLVLLRLSDAAVENPDADARQRSADCI